MRCLVDRTAGAPSPAHAMVPDACEQLSGAPYEPLSPQFAVTAAPADRA